MAASARAARCSEVSPSQRWTRVRRVRSDSVPRRCSRGWPVIRQKRVASRTASAARMREKDDRANSDRFRWTPHVARKAAVADSVERLHTPLGDNESARDKWVVHQLVNDTCSPQNDAVACARGRKVSLTFASWNRFVDWLRLVDGVRLAASAAQRRHQRG